MFARWRCRVSRLRLLRLRGFAFHRGPMQFLDIAGTFRRWAGRGWRAVWETGLADAGLCATDSPAFERYGEQFDGKTGMGGIEIWVLVVEGFLDERVDGSAGFDGGADREGFGEGQLGRSEGDGVIHFDCSYEFGSLTGYLPAGSTGIMRSALMAVRMGRPLAIVCLAGVVCCVCCVVEETTMRQEAFRSSHEKVSSA